MISLVDDQYVECLSLQTSDNVYEVSCGVGPFDVLMMRTESVVGTCSARSM